MVSREESKGEAHICKAMMCHEEGGGLTNRWSEVGAWKGWKYESNGDTILMFQIQSVIQEG